MPETRVFLVSWDVERFQASSYDLPDEKISLDDHVLFRGDSRLEDWEPIPIYGDQPHLEEPDLWYHTATQLPVMSRARAPRRSTSSKSSDQPLSVTGSDLVTVCY